VRAGVGVGLGVGWGGGGEGDGVGVGKSLTKFVRASLIHPIVLKLPFTQQDCVPVNMIYLTMLQIAQILRFLRLI